MSFEGIVQITTLDNEVSVNQILDSGKGWELLAITPGPVGVLYTIGRRANSSAEASKNLGMLLKSRPGQAIGTDD
ncbi:hypothetical protein [Pseudomonas viridiflava]|uniref:hypothetical protein n=1 Tax=Pseudomonas viridiflava TaxID=33069 RepID=UPI000F01DE6E|nr:hypothetical protein [Pseudomonas viridiflava]